MAEKNYIRLEGSDITLIGRPRFPNECTVVPRSIKDWPKVEKPTPNLSLKKNLDAAWRATFGTEPI